MINIQELIDGFIEAGLRNGDVLLVHSSFKSFGEVEGGPQTVIDALVKVLGKEGTLIVPTFNFDFCDGKPFDIHTTPSQMGIITELIRKNPDSKRILHPIHSFSIIGKLSEFFGSLKYKSSFGKDSLFAKIRELDGKIMIIGLAYNNSITFFHHIEEMEGCDYRHFKEFKGTITDENGNTYEDSFIMFARDLDRGVITMVEPMGNILEKEGVVKVMKIGDSTVKLMKVNDVYNITSREIKKDPNLLYQIRNS